MSGVERLGEFFEGKQTDLLRVVFENATRANQKYGASITFNDLRTELLARGLSAERFDSFVRTKVPRYRISARVNGWHG